MVREVRQAVKEACAAMTSGARWSSIVAILESWAERGGWRLAPSFPGHGIGRSLHEPPKAWTAPDGERAPRDFVLRPGMVLTLEPIAVLGEPEIIGLDDGWTVVTKDRAWACHEERMIAITRGGPRTLTA
jgi:methionyl aminopeptidase